MMTPSPQVTEQDDQGDQWLQPPSCLTAAHTQLTPHALMLFRSPDGSVKKVGRLTALVAFLGVAVTGLDRGALAVAVDAVTGASTLLDASTASDRALGPRRPGGPTTLSSDHCCS